MVAPIAIEIIIHYYTTRSIDFKDSPAFREQVEMLIEKGLIKESHGELDYEANREACKAYIDALCSVPLPELKWIIPKQ